jgi:hypothetical protein
VQFDKPPPSLDPIGVEQARLTPVSNRELNKRLKQVLEARRNSPCPGVLLRYVNDEQLYYIAECVPNIGVQLTLHRGPRLLAQVVTRGRVLVNNASVYVQQSGISITFDDEGLMVFDDPEEPYQKYYDEDYKASWNGKWMFNEQAERVKQLCAQMTLEINKELLDAYQKNEEVAAKCREYAVEHLLSSRVLKAFPRPQAIGSVVTGGHLFTSLTFGARVTGRYIQSIETAQGKDVPGLIFARRYVVSFTRPRISMLPHGSSVWRVFDLVTGEQVDEPPQTEQYTMRGALVPVQEPEMCLAIHCDQVIVNNAIAYW